MKTISYLFDFKNIINQSSLEGCLKDWTVKKVSDRTFEVSEREYDRTDIVKFYQYIGTDGHIFIYEFESGKEYYRPKHLKGHKQGRAKDADLDINTVHRLSAYLASRQRQELA